MLKFKLNNFEYLQIFKLYSLNCLKFIIYCLLYNIYLLQIYYHQVFIFKLRVIFVMAIIKFYNHFKIFLNFLNVDQFKLNF